MGGTVPSDYEAPVSSLSHVLVVSKSQHDFVDGIGVFLDCESFLTMLVYHHMFEGWSYLGDSRAPSKIRQRGSNDMEVWSIFAVLEKGEKFSHFNKTPRP